MKSNNLQKCDCGGELEYFYPITYHDIMTARDTVSHLYRCEKCGKRYEFEKKISEE